jgi:hypothetical protein
MRAAVVRLRSAHLLAHPKLNDVHPRAWLADVLARLPDPPESAFTNSYLGNWRAQNVPHAARAQSAVPKATQPAPSPDVYQVRRIALSGRTALR